MDGIISTFSRKGKEERYKIGRNHSSQAVTLTQFPTSSGHHPQTHSNCQEPPGKDMTSFPIDPTLSLRPHGPSTGPSPSAPKLHPHLHPSTSSQIPTILYFTRAGNLGSTLNSSLSLAINTHQSLSPVDSAS